jgi:hypothetical protein
LENAPERHEVPVDGQQERRDQCRRPAKQRPRQRVEGEHPGHAGQRERQPCHKLGDLPDPAREQVRQQDLAGHLAVGSQRAGLSLERGHRAQHDPHFVALKLAPAEVGEAQHASHRRYQQD